MMIGPRNIIMGIIGAANITASIPIQVVQLDVNDDRSVKEAIDKIGSEQERINVLVNNAGYLLIGPVEELSLEEFKEQF